MRRAAPLVLIVLLLAGTLAVPGQSRLGFRPDGPRIALAELTQPLIPGDGVIVTLVFAESGRIGVVSRVE